MRYHSTLASWTSARNYPISLRDGREISTPAVKCPRAPPSSRICLEAQGKHFLAAPTPFIRPLRVLRWHCTRDKPIFGSYPKSRIPFADASEKLLSGIKDVVDPEKERKFIGNTFNIFEEAIKLEKALCTRTSSNRASDCLRMKSELAAGARHQELGMRHPFPGQASPLQTTLLVRSGAHSLWR